MLFDHKIIMIIFKLKIVTIKNYVLRKYTFLNTETTRTNIFKIIIIIYNKSTYENKDDFGLATEIKIYYKCLIFFFKWFC